MFKTYQHKQTRESGITLLLSVLVMSGILVVIMAIAGFAVQELRASRASALSEPAIVAAETSGEQGIWLIKRGTTPASCSSTTPTTQIDGTTSASGSGASRIVTSKCTAYDKAVFKIDPLDSKTFFIVDPNAVNGNLCMNTVFVSGTYSGCVPNSATQLFKTLRFNVKSGTLQPSVSVTTLDGVMVVSSGGTVVGNPFNLTTDGTNNDFGIPDPISGSSDERLRVTITAPNDYVTVEVTSVGGILTGLPDYPTVDAQGCSAIAVITNCNASSEIFKRRLFITVPK